MARGPVSARYLSSIGVALAVALAPAMGFACPQCAGRSDGGIAQGVILGVFVLFPFAVVGTVMKIIKRGEPGAPESRRSFS